MKRRLPTEVIEIGCKHRGAALWLNDDTVLIEAEAISAILANSAGKFLKPVRVGIFWYGTAPDSSLNEQDNLMPEKAQGPSVANARLEEEEEDALRPHQPGYRDIRFPGLKDVPKWILQVLRRVHTNLGHPSREVLIRHLAHAGASDAALRAAKHLQCEVCRRVQPPRQPRPAKPYVPARFNQKLVMDVVFLKDIAGKVHGYLNLVDDATCYQVLNYMQNRSEEEAIKLFVNGWMTFFGPPDEIHVDADGCFKGYRFETLQAQCAVKIRYVPSDAHYQLGRAERHGQAIRHVVAPLVSQFTPISVTDMNVIVAMATAAKNSLMRRWGSTPCQQVFGHLPKLPGALLSSGGSIEACQLVDDSERVRQTEAVRAAAMAQYHNFEYNSALRRAMLRKARPFRGPFEQGQRIAYYCARNAMDGEGTVEGYRQGIIVALDGPNGNLWVRNSRGRLVLCAREQCRPILPGGEEEWWTPNDEDLQLLKNFEEDLSKKHALAFRAPHHLPQPRDDAQVVADLDQQTWPKLRLYDQHHWFWTQRATRSTRQPL